MHGVISFTGATSCESKELSRLQIFLHQFQTTPLTDTEQRSAQSSSGDDSDNDERQDKETKLATESVSIPRQQALEDADEKSHSENFQPSTNATQNNESLLNHPGENKVIEYGNAVDTIVEKDIEKTNAGEPSSVQTSVIQSDNGVNRIPTVVNPVDTQTSTSVGNQAYYQDVDRTVPFSATNNALLNKYSTKYDSTNINVSCETPNLSYQPYQNPGVYPYQPDAQVYSHYEHHAHYSQHHNSLIDHEQLHSRENDPNVVPTDQRSYTSLSTGSQHDSNHSSVKAEPRNASSPGPSSSTTNWPTYIPIPNMEIPDYSQCQQYTDYCRPETRGFIDTPATANEKSLCDPMLAGASDVDDLAHLESQAFPVPASSAPLYPGTVKYEAEPFSLARSRQYSDQYQRSVIHSTVTESGGENHKKSVKVPAGNYKSFHKLMVLIKLLLYTNLSITLHHAS